MANVQRPSDKEPIALPDGRINPRWLQYWQDLERRLAALEAA